MPKLLWMIAGGLVLLFLIITISARTAKRPDTLGVRDGRLSPCPDKPNCVSTKSEGSQRMDPLPYTASLEDAQDRLRAILSSRSRTEIVEDQPGYLAIEFHSRVFGFIDDGEFQFDDEVKVVHFRSAARLGHSDMGVNRTRMGEIFKAFLETK